MTHQSPLFGVMLAQPGRNMTVGSKYGGTFIPIRGNGQKLVVTWDQPHGTLWGSYELESVIYKIGSGKWRKVERERHGTRYIITINNQKSGAESFVMVKVTYRYVAITTDNHGERDTESQARVATAERTYQIKYYKH